MRGEQIYWKRENKRINVNLSLAERLDDQRGWNHHMDSEEGMMDESVP